MEEIDKAEEPVPKADEPEVETPEQVVETPEPVVETPEQVGETLEPGAETSEPEVENPEQVVESTAIAVYTPKDGSQKPRRGFWTRGKVVAASVLGLLICGSAVAATVLAVNVWSKEVVDDVKSPNGVTVLTVSQGTPKFVDECKVYGISDPNSIGYIKIPLEVKIEDTAEAKKAFPDGVALNGNTFRVVNEAGDTVSRVTETAKVCWDSPADGELVAGQSFKGTVILETRVKDGKVVMDLGYGDTAEWQIDLNK